jgi:hypothetical protein
MYVCTLYSILRKQNMYLACNDHFALNCTILTASSAAKLNTTFSPIYVYTFIRACNEIEYYLRSHPPPPHPFQGLVCIGCTILPILISAFYFFCFTRTIALVIPLPVSSSSPRLPFVSYLCLLIS